MAAHEVVRPEQPEPSLSYSTLLRFFLPLSFSAGMVYLSHVIIHSTLARSPYSVTVIASYSVALTLYAILERPLVLLRQTSSALVRDGTSFRAMQHFSFRLIGTATLAALLISYTPLGEWLFPRLFGVKEAWLNETITAFRVILFVLLFSGIRCLYQGVIIYYRLTKWMTIGMVIRLFFMCLVAWLFIKNDAVRAGYVGAVIFLVGMAIECCVSVWEGRKLVRELPERSEGHEVKTAGQVFGFFRPLLFAAMFATVISPSVNAALGWSDKAELAVASYAVALSFSQLVFSFCTYMHQLVINFYQQDSQVVNRFAAFIGLLPATLLGVISFTPLGEWVLTHMIGVEGMLLAESTRVLRFLVLYALLYPFLDYSNGLLMLKRQTGVMAYSQAGNALGVLVVLLLLSKVAPSLGGIMGAAALSFGVAVELWIVRRNLGRINHTVTLSQ